MYLAKTSNSIPILRNKAMKKYMPMNSQTSKRRIDTRYIPPVAGIDLVQALNYLDLDDVGVDFIYDNYTSAHVPYVKGNRPLLESAATGCGLAELDIVKHLTGFAAEQVRWAGFFYKENGVPLPKNRAFDEERIIESKYGWCNEQARVLCCLTQICGFPSRLVFASNKIARCGHVLTEVLLSSGWMLVDQSLNFLFEINGKPVRAADVSKNKDVRAHFRAVYKKVCHDTVVSLLPVDYLSDNFSMSLLDDPMDGFENLGYHNHFVI